MKVLKVLCCIFLALCVWLIWEDNNTPTIAQDLQSRMIFDAATDACYVGCSQAEGDARYHVVWEAAKAGAFDMRPEDYGKTPREAATVRLRQLHLPVPQGQWKEPGEIRTVPLSGN